MSTPAQKANLARIRDNQRRSRARRREYLQELEQRIRVYELQGIEASSEVQQAARRVVEENRQLRGLLNRHGITDDVISSYLHTGSAAVQTDPTPIPHFPSSNPSETVQSLRHVRATRRSAPIGPDVCVSATNVSLWEGQLRPALQLGPASDQPLPRKIPPSTQPVLFHMLPQEQDFPVYPVTQAPLVGAHDSGAAFECPPGHSPAG